MTIEEKIAMLEDVLCTDEGVLKAETALDDVEEWDSVGVLSFMAMMDDEFEKTIKSAEIKKCANVSDLLAIMEK